MFEKSAISSVRLGIDAYRKAQGRPALARPHLKAGTRRAKANAASELSNPANSSARELKSTVLKSLHSQSNSGMVSIRDVAAALDNHLKRR